MKGEPKTERFEMRAPADLLRSVDDWRRHQPDLPSRSEAIRRLIEAGLITQAGAGSGGKRPDVQGKGFPPTTLGRSGADTEGTLPPSTKKPRAKPAAMSKEAQIRALREQGMR